MAKQNDNIQIMVRVPPELHASIISDAKDEGETISTIVRRRLRERYEEMRDEYRTKNTPVCETNA